MVIGDGYENFTGDMRGCGMGIVKTLAQWVEEWTLRWWNGESK